MTDRNVVYMVPDEQINSTAGRLTRYQGAESFGGDAEQLRRTAKKMGWKAFFESCTFTHCDILGPAPFGYENWDTWIASPVKLFATIKAMPLHSLPPGSYSTQYPFTVGPDILAGRYLKLREWGVSINSPTLGSGSVFFSGQALDVVVDEGAKSSAFESPATLLARALDLLRPLAEDFSSVNANAKAAAEFLASMDQNHKGQDK